LRQTAVFTNIAGPTPDKGPQRIFHHECLRTMARAFARNTVTT
jgi:hypothetical protein